MSQTIKATQAFRNGLPFASNTLTTVMYKHNGPLRVADCIDLDEEGLWLRANEVLKVGDKIEVKFTIPELDTVLYLWGRVRELKPAEHRYTSASMYVKFIKLGEKERSHLHHYLNGTMPEELVEHRQAKFRKVGTHVEVPRVGYRRERIVGPYAADLTSLTSTPEPLTQYIAGATTDELPRFDARATQSYEQPHEPCDRTNSQVRQADLTTSKAFVYQDESKWFAEVNYKTHEEFKTSFEHNIQYGGFLLHTDCEIPNDTPLRLHLVPPNHERGVWMDAKVVWQSKKTGVGLELQALTPELRALFHYFLDIKP